MIRNGVDIESVARFKNRDKDFFDAIFTQQEQDYCRSKSFPEQHFCGIYCAKEALSKALSGIVDDVNYVDLIVEHDNDGRPLFVLPEKIKHFNTELSISHTTEFAVASVILYTK